MDLACLGICMLGTAFGLMGSWFVWFRVDSGFWPFQYTEAEFTHSLYTPPPPVHIPELLVSVTFYLVVVSFIFMAIGTWKKMPKPKRIRDKE